MTRVFIGGSRRSSRLNTQVLERLDSIIEKRIPVLVGDANGADKAVQEYLYEKHYEDVEVFCSDGVCRNNIGGWPVRSIPTKTRRRDAQFYSAKDRAMAVEATVGLMIWDGKSVGTLLNVYRLLTAGKKAVVYAVPERRFLEFRTGTEWERFLADRETNLRDKVEQRARDEATKDKQLHFAHLGK